MVSRIPPTTTKSIATQASSKKWHRAVIEAMHPLQIHPKPASRLLVRAEILITLRIVVKLYNLGNNDEVGGWNL